MRKKISTTLYLLAFVLFAKAQPQAFSYQAIARDKIGQPLGNKNISVRFSILTGSATGTTVYSETHATNTNAFGLFFLSVGKGTGASGTFADINWADGEKFLKMEIDPAGGSNYQLQNTTQLLSVPYALYSEKTKLNAGNAITITNGNTISANYLGGSGIAIIGNTISHNLVGGNAITITGNSIAANYQAGTGVSITGRTISGDYQAGNGISITNGVIAATGGGSGYWIKDANGIYLPPATGNVGIGTNSIPRIALNLYQDNGTTGHPVMYMTVKDTWMTWYIMKNLSSNGEWGFGVGGSANAPNQGEGMGPKNFGIVNQNSYGTVGYPTFPFTINYLNDYVGIGMGGVNAVPKSGLHVRSGDVYIEKITSGVIMKSPDGKCWRMTVSNAGAPVFTTIPCP